MEKRYKTPAAFARAVQRYFDSICVVQPLIVQEIALTDNGDGTYSAEMDAFGHPNKRFVQKIVKDGKPATEELWIKKPSLAGLCLFLGIHRSTWAEYGKKEGDADTVERARGRVEEYLAGKVLEKGAAAGAKFSLQHNCGWKERQEISLDEKTREAVSKTMTAQEKLELLRELGLRLPGEEDENEDRQADPDDKNAETDAIWRRNPADVGQRDRGDGVK